MLLYVARTDYLRYIIEEVHFLTSSYFRKSLGGFQRHTTTRHISHLPVWTEWCCLSANISTFYWESPVKSDQSPAKHSIIEAVGPTWRQWAWMYAWACISARLLGDTVVQIRLHQEMDQTQARTETELHPRLYLLHKHVHSPRHTRHMPEPYGPMQNLQALILVEYAHRLLNIENDIT